MRYLREPALLLVLLIVCLVPARGAHAALGAEERIDAVTEFLIERAQANAFYIFENRLRDNRILQCYFPNTHKLAARGELAVLMKSRYLWEETIEKDVAALLALAAYQLTDWYAETAQRIEIEVAGEWYPVHVLPPQGRDPAREREVNALYTDFNGFRDALLAFSNARAMLDGCVVASGGRPDYERLKDAVRLLKQWFRAIDDRKGRLRYRLDDGTPIGIGVLTPRFEAIHQLLGGLIEEISRRRHEPDASGERPDRLHFVKLVLLATEFIEATIVDDALRDVEDRLRERLGAHIGRDIPDAAWSAAWKGLWPEIRRDLATAVGSGTSVRVAVRDDARASVAVALGLEPGDLDWRAIQKRAAAEIRTWIERRTDEGVAAADIDPYGRRFVRFKRYVLFFAQVNEAESKQEVKELLRAATLPAVSFGIKREAATPVVVTVNAYLGGAAGLEGKGYGGLAAPLGLELSRPGWPKDRWSLGLLLAPFDFAHPVNIALYDEQGTSTVKDIVVPGAYVTLGWREMPLAVLAGYSSGTALRSSRDSDQRYVLAVAFDMPLFQLFH